MNKYHNPKKTPNCLLHKKKDLEEKIGNITNQLTQTKEEKEMLEEYEKKWNVTEQENTNLNKKFNEISEKLELSIQQKQESDLKQLTITQKVQELTLEVKEKENEKKLLLKQINEMQEQLLIEKNMKQKLEGEINDLKLRLSEDHLNAELKVVEREEIYQKEKLVCEETFLKEKKKKWN